ncbi:hypothetical protein PtA15_3A414 [Puccinia triticina]|uniref:PCI domain-containing protein n=1 Tax=Puccinia triticina TaxID=208348 RepID=A0ABY7CCU9_9BASI|nr:uncharacterized protein PtA15_3A414 [Puccinia triticina]WAQ83048.1 hypothetical protein PtA15_3A414 [Puccinia triticina]
MAEPTARKQEKDFTKEVDELVADVGQLVKNGGLQQGLEKLLGLEKQTRNASDLSSTSRLLLEVVQIVFESKDIDGLCLHVHQLARKHGQLRQATTTMVDRVMSFLGELDQANKIKLIDSLREVTEGKIYLEVQRARLTKQLAQIREAEGAPGTANELMQELQVETFGSMERREKMDFILEQMRLLRTQEDWEKLAIVSKKINSKWLGEAENEDLKLRFYGLMISYGSKMSRHLDLCKYYRSIHECKSVEAEPAQALAALRNAVYFVILAPYDHEQSDLLHRLAQEEEELKKIEAVYDLVKCFTTPELMRWPGIQELYGPVLRKSRVFGPAGTSGLVGDIAEDDPLAGDRRWEELHKRVVEHNIRAVSRYYSRLTLERLSELLDLSPGESERRLAQLVSSGTVCAKIDRPAGVVRFGGGSASAAGREGERVLNGWNGDVGRLLGLVEKTVHLIQKEFALQGINVVPHPQPPSHPRMLDPSAKLIFQAYAVLFLDGRLECYPGDPFSVGSAHEAAKPTHILQLNPHHRWVLQATQNSPASFPFTIARQPLTLLGLDVEAMGTTNRTSLTNNTPSDSLKALKDRKSLKQIFGFRPRRNPHPARHTPTLIDLQDPCPDLPPLHDHPHHAPGSARSSQLNSPASSSTSPHPTTIHPAQNTLTFAASSESARKQWITQHQQTPIRSTLSNSSFPNSNSNAHHTSRIPLAPIQQPRSSSSASIATSHNFSADLLSPTHSPHAGLLSHKPSSPSPPSPHSHPLSVSASSHTEMAVAVPAWIKAVRNADERKPGPDPDLLSEKAGSSASREGSLDQQPGSARMAHSFSAPAPLAGPDRPAAAAAKPAPAPSIKSFGSAVVQNLKRAGSLSEWPDYASPAHSILQRMREPDPLSDSPRPASPDPSDGAAPHQKRLWLLSAVKKKSSLDTKLPAPSPLNPALPAGPAAAAAGGWSPGCSAALPPRSSSRTARDSLHQVLSQATEDSEPGDQAPVADPSPLPQLPQPSSTQSTYFQHPAGPAKRPQTATSKKAFALAPADVGLSIRAHRPPGPSRRDLVRAGLSGDALLAPVPRPKTATASTDLRPTLTSSAGPTTSRALASGLEGEFGAVGNAPSAPYQCPVSVP